MNTRSVVLGDIADTCLGKMLDQQKNKGEYQPYLANINVRWGGFDLEALPQMRFLETEEERYGLKYGDILVCEGGEPGRCAIWKDQIPNMKFQKALHRVRVHQDEVDFRWLFYRFLYAKFRGEFDQYYSGTTTIKHMPGEKLVKIRIDLPELSYQRKIGDVLSVYDDLIENNQKQIKLLEEAAQRLYKEWFVDLRFPGYENTPIVDGLPEGWSYKPLSDLFRFVRGKSYTSKELSDTSGVLMVIRAFGGYNRNAEKRFTGIYKNEQSLNPGDLIMGVTDMTQERRLVGHAAIVPDLGEPMTFSMDLIKLLPVKIQKSYLYSTLFFGGFSKKISPIANGVNVLHLKPEAMMSLQMLVPTSELMDVYEQMFSPIQSRIELLQKQMDVAKEARDRLLPKLMSGEIEV